MSNFNRENRPGGNRNFGRPRFNNDRPDMHTATCAECGKSCEVPFRPTGNKPVYCSDCFKKNGGPDTRRSESRSFGRGRSNDRQMHDAVCARCGKDCQIPFRPSSGRDVFCSRCFEKNEEGTSFEKPQFNRSDSAPDFSAQFKELNAKLDAVLRLLKPVETSTTPDVPTPQEIAVAQKPAVEKKPKKVRVKKA